MHHLHNWIIAHEFSRFDLWLTAYVEIKQKENSVAQLTPSSVGKLQSLD